MKETLLYAQDICKRFTKGKNSVPVLDHVTVSIYQGDFTVIMGPSGAGKSTLLYALSGMDQISSGQVVYKGKTISHMNEKQMAGLRSHEFGFVFQQANLVSNLTLFENVAVPGYLKKDRRRKDRSRKDPDGRQVIKRAEILLNQMNVGEAKERMPSEVSGGEAQRAAIARAVINDPGLIFADEPTGALNKSNSQDVLNLLTAVHEKGQSILMVTHDIRAALRGNRILYLEDGRILDELELPVYRNSEIKEREEKVNQWLSSLRW